MYTHGIQLIQYKFCNACSMLDIGGTDTSMREIIELGERGY